MGEAILVAQDVEEGARLIQELDVRGVPVTAAFWAHESNRDIWQLVVAISRKDLPSPRSAYKRMQDAILDLGLHLQLNRITIVSDDDIFIKDLRFLIEAGFEDVVEIPVIGSEIAGESVDRGFAYRFEALRFERQLFTTLQRLQPPSAVLRRAHPRIAESGGGDFILDDGVRTVVVEARSLPRAMSVGDLRRIVGKFLDSSIIHHRSASFLIVASSGYTKEVHNWFAESNRDTVTFRDIHLAKWSGPEDDQTLREILSQLISLP